METQPPKISTKPFWPWSAFFITAGMTYMTFAKELVWFQNERHSPLVLIYKVATRLYYPLLWLNLGLLIFIALKYSNRTPRLLLAAFILFGVNVVIFSSNNVINFFEGKPLHRRHQGIGW